MCVCVCVLVGPREPIKVSDYSLRWEVTIIIEYEVKSHMQINRQQIAVSVHYYPRQD